MFCLDNQVLGRPPYHAVDRDNQAGSPQPKICALSLYQLYVWSNQAFSISGCKTRHDALMAETNLA